MKTISHTKLNKILGISLKTLGNWKSYPVTDSKHIIYSLLVSMNEEELIKKVSAIKEQANS